jgi:competence protein ComFC
MESIIKYPQQIFRNIFLPVWHFIYPPVCFTCEQILQDANLKICPNCWNSFKKITPEDSQWLELKEKFSLEGLVENFLSCYLFEKEGRLQDVIHLLKYRGIKSLGIRFGKEIGSRVLNNSDFTKADYLIPVPLHKLKHRERGYNQSEWICKGISRAIGIPMQVNLLKRIKHTQSQTQLNISERKENVNEAFSIDKKFYSLIKNKTIILVDDVITTGATINSCAKELIAKGAHKIYCVSIALAK